jgi:ABC-type lipoprotein release transport system permease subunit
VSNSAIAWLTSAAAAASSVENWEVNAGALHGRRQSRQWLRGKRQTPLELQRPISTAFAVFLGIAALAAYLPARRALRVYAVMAVRYERMARPARKWLT